MNDLSLAELEAQQAELTRRIELIKKEERSKVLATVRQEVVRFGFSCEEIMQGTKRERVSAPAKFRNPVSGETWTGRGRTPKWMEGRDKAEFAITG